MKNIMKKRSGYPRRKSKNLPYRKIFHMFTEGNRTEACYFDILRAVADQVTIKSYPSNHKSDPTQVLAKAQKFIKESGLQHNEYVWIVVDVDNRAASLFAPLHAWEKTDPRFGLAMSNPNFEYWLLLHYDDGHKVADRKSCQKRLREHLPHFEKNQLTMDSINIKRVVKACERAEARERQCENIYKDSYSTVYLPVKQMLNI
jgi:hypothetical protein